MNNRRDTLIFIPFPEMGHLVPSMELIKLLLHRHQTISIAVFLIKPIHESKQISALIQSISTHNPRLHFHHLHPIQPPPPSPLPFPFSAVFHTIPLYNQQVKDSLLSIGVSRTLGLILDMFCTSFIDVALHLNLPSYIFYTSAISMLGLALNLDDTLSLLSDYISTPLPPSHSTLSIPTLPLPIPLHLLPSFFTNQTMIPFLLRRSLDLKKAHGFLVNSFSELEPHAAKAMEEAKIAVYPIGPIVKAEEAGNEVEGVVEWLDLQPNRSVVFLCFGSKGSFSGEQVREVADGVERSGYRFLWSLRKEVDEVGGGGRMAPGEEIGLEDLPEGFVKRTEGVGRVIGWAPQKTILEHEAVGGFVSHCGWNSTLESLWCGVPMAAWPMYAEQNLNAFVLVRILGLAVEVRMEYKKGEGVVVEAEVVEKGIRKLMEGGDGVREKVRSVREEALKAMTCEEKGSSVLALRRFIQDLMTSSSSSS